MVVISPEAAQKIKSLKSEEGHTDLAALRVEVKKGGCSGLSYKMSFSDSFAETDKVFEAHGQKIVIDSQSLMYVIGLTLDYSGGLNGKGFVFNNPNATKNCGCGSSFNV